MSVVTRRRYLGSAMVACGGLLAACGPLGERGAPGAGAGPSKLPVTLRVNYRTEKYFPVRAEQFTTASPHIKVELIANSGYEKLVALVAAGDLGDLIWASTGIGTYFEFAAQGHFMQLDSLVARDKYDLRQHFARAIEVSRTVDSKLFGLPTLIHPSHIGLFYNVNLLEQAGVKLPTVNWRVDDLVDAARRLTADTDRDGKPDRWGIQTETAYAPLLCWLRSFGAEMLDPPVLGKRPAIDRGPAKQTFQWLYDLRQKHRVHPVQGVDKASFTDGNLAMQQTGMWGMTMAKQIGDRFKMDAVLIPIGPSGKRGSQGHVDQLAMYARTKHRDEAWLLHKWFVNKETSPYVFQEHGIPGARPDGWNHPEALATPMFKVFKEFMEREGPGPIALPWNFRMLDIGNAVAKAVEPMWTGQQAPEQTIAAALGPIQAQLDLPRPGK